MGNVVQPFQFRANRTAQRSSSRAMNTTIAVVSPCSSEPTT
jgi:hypothetical protein